MTLSAKQHALIRVAKLQLDLTDDDYRAILRNVCGVESSKQLDNVGFDILVAELERRGFNRSKPKKGLGQRAGMATEAQLGTISRMWGEFAGAEDAAGLRTWLERTAKISDVRFLDQDGAHKAINGLRAMIARKESHEAAPYTGRVAAAAHPGPAQQDRHRSGRPRLRAPPPSTHDLLGASGGLPGQIWPRTGALPIGHRPLLARQPGPRCDLGRR